MFRALVLFLAMCLSSALYASGVVSPWTITAKVPPVEKHVGDTVANGMIGLAVTRIPFTTDQTVLYGSYERTWPGSVSCLVRSFHFLSLRVSIDGVALDHPEQLINYRQTVDFQRAAITTSFEYEGNAAIEYTVRALRQLPQSALMEVRVHAKQPLGISVETAMDLPSSDVATPWREERVFAWLTNVRAYGPDKTEQGAAANP